ncbi:MAG: DNA double-strand break repair nuclease NurA [Nitrososphaerota archaeon]
MQGEREMSPEEIAFSRLPSVLVEEMVRKSREVGESLAQSLGEIHQRRNEFREELERKGLLEHESSLGVAVPPTTCAVDGAYVVERLLSVDLTAMSAVALEGLTPPREERYWERPYHSFFMWVEPHHVDTPRVLRAVMLGNEVRLAAKAPHRLVFLDGSLALLVIYFTQVFLRAPAIQDLDCSKTFFRECCDYLRDYLTILYAERTDRQFAGVVKYTVRREIAKMMRQLPNCDDRGILTLILKAGELTRPQPLEHDRRWNLDVSLLPQDLRRQIRDLVGEVIERVQEVHVFYYRPYEWLPVFRVEVPGPVAGNRYRLLTVIQGIKHQCVTGAMKEPYPLHFADMIAKDSMSCLPVVRQVIIQEVMKRYKGSLGEVFFALHSYRSEGGGVDL